MKTKKHIVITGTGRSGTTFLVELLTNIGLNTGYSSAELAFNKSKLSHAGLEHKIGTENCPYIAKDPFLCDYINDVINRDDITIEHIFIPIRDLNAAAESRRYIEKIGYSKLSFINKLKHMINPQEFPGGLWHTNSKKHGKQEEILLNQLYKLMLAISRTSIPVTLIQYPRIIKDSQYLFDKLKPVLKDTDFVFFLKAFDKTVCPELVHKFNENDC